MISYGLPLIYSTVACDAAPSVRLFLCSLAPPRGSHEEKRQHYDDEDSQQERPRASSGGARTGIGTGSTAMFSTPTACITSAEHGGAHWLLDEIAIIQPYNKAVAAEEFQVWKLAVRPDRSATLTCDDGNGTSCVPGDRAHGFPLGRNYAVLREQRDPSAERILVKVKPALASSLARVSRLTCVSRSRKSPSAPHIHSLLTELFPLGRCRPREFIGQSPRMESSWLTCSGGWSQAMSEFARTPIEPARAFPPASTGSPIGSTDLRE